MSTPDLPLLTFPHADAFEAWLASQPEPAAGAWLRFGKPGAPETTLSKTDAIDSALAYGWIDGQLGRVDGHHYKVRFTPRRDRSAWSQVNRDRVERLVAEGRMKPGGLAQVTRAKEDGRWEAAYAPQSRATADPDFLAPRCPARGTPVLRQSRRGEPLCRALPRPPGEGAGEAHGHDRRTRVAARPR